MRKVINKMVTEEDLIRTVTTAYANGWRQVKLYFMCGLPTETDEDVLAIADLARKVIAAGPGGHRPQGHPLHGVDRRVRAQAAHAVPVGRACSATRRSTRRLRALRRRDPRRPAVRQGRSASATTTASPSMVEGLLSRGDRRVGEVIRAVWRDGGRFDGWSEYFSFDRWVAACEAALASTAGRSRLVHHARTRLRSRYCRGTTWTQAWTGTGSGRTGRTPQSSPTVRRGRRLPVDPVLRLWRVLDRWVPRSRSGRPEIGWTEGACCPCWRLTGDESWAAGAVQRERRRAGHNCASSRPVC